MNGIQIFDYGSNHVRTKLIGNEPWFIANDVCTALGIIRVSGVCWALFVVIKRK